MADLNALLRLVGTSRDTAVLRLALGSEFLKSGDTDNAIPHLNVAVEKDPTYSAAWKVLGNALGRAHRFDEAMTAYQRGISAAEAKGDVQGAKEMKVFVRRVERHG